jgi:hypothetical protein
MEILARISRKAHQAIFSMIYNCLCLSSRSADSDMKRFRLTWIDHCLGQ